MSGTLAPCSKLWRLVGASFLAALAGSFFGALIVLGTLSVMAPGDGGVQGGIMTALILIFPVTVFVFIIALPMLFVVGIPATWPFASTISDNPVLAVGAGGVVGALIGGLADLLLSMKGVQVALAPVICGGLVGLFWILFGLTVGAFDRHAEPPHA